MGKLVVIKDDEVKGTDKHDVAGMDTSTPPVAYKGVGEYEYVGKMTDQLSDFVTVDGKAVALKSSKSSLNPGETVTGKHSGRAGKNFTPTAPAPNPETLQITPDLVGEGKPSASSGSSFVKVGGVAILLDGDKIDTCDGLGIPMNSTVTAKEQDFVSCSE
jgi:uncharacterized Zn-binding protein involved in type VI secretion